MLGGMQDSAEAVDLSKEAWRVFVYGGCVSRALFFTSGVFFSVDRFSGSPTAQKIMENNPGYIFLQACRDVTIYNKLPDLSSWIHLIAWSFGLLIIGFIFFWKAEERYASVK